MKGFLAALLLSAPSPLWARAAGDIPAYELGLGLGQAIILGRQSDRLSDCPALYLYWMRRYDNGILGGVELGQTLGSTIKGKLSAEAPQDLDLPRDEANDDLPFKSSLKSTTFWLTPQIKIGRSDEETESSVRPYAVLGGGYYNIRNKAGTASVSGRTSTGVVVTDAKVAIKARSSHYLGFNLGGGFIAHLFTNVELAADVRFHYVLAGGDSRQFLFPAARINILF